MLVPVSCFWLGRRQLCPRSQGLLHARRPGGGGPNHEGIDFYENGCYNLIENNVCVRAGNPAIILGDWGGGCAGNVIGYNYIVDCESGTSQSAYALCDNHGPHNMFNLFEGNIAQSFATDGYYGGSSHTTIFRTVISAECYTNSEWPTSGISRCIWAIGLITTMSSAMSLGQSD